MNGFVEIVGQSGEETEKEEPDNGEQNVDLFLCDGSKICVCVEAVL